MEQFLNSVDDFLEYGATQNNMSMSISENKRVVHFVHGNRRLTLVRGIVSDTGVLDDAVGKLPLGFTRHVLKKINPEFVEE